MQLIDQVRVVAEPYGVQETLCVCIYIYIYIYIDLCGIFHINIH